MPWSISQAVNLRGISWASRSIPPASVGCSRRAVTPDWRNVRVAMADALDVLERWLVPSSAEEVLVWFPDPWPKKRHHKRRLVQAGFASLVHRVLQPGGRLHLATDWEPYARHMLEVLDTHPGFSNHAGPGRFMPAPCRRRETRFETRGRRLGHRVFDLVWLAIERDATE